MKKILGATLVISLITVINIGTASAQAPVPSGAQYTFLSFNAASLALGGSLSPLGDPSIASINNASLALQKRYSISLNTAVAPIDNNFLNLGTGIYTPIGTFGLNINYLHGDSSTNPNTNLGNHHFIGGNLLFSRSLTPYVHVGFGLRWIYAQSQSDKGFGMGADVGALYSFSGYQKDQGIGFNNAVVHLALVNLGVGAKLENLNYFPGIGIALGGAFSLFKYPEFEWRFYLEMLGTFLPLCFNFRVATEFIIYEIGHVRVGFNPSGIEIGMLKSLDRIGENYLGWWFLGFGLSYEIWDIEWALDYTLAPSDFDNDGDASFNNYEYRHYIGLSVAFGRVDTDEPEVDINPSVPPDPEDGRIYISPRNNDDVQDKVVFSLDASDESSIIKKWSFEITDEAGNQIYFEEGSASDDFSFDLFLEMFSPETDTHIPDSISWEGKSQSGDYVEDGVYYYTFIVEDEQGNISRIERKPIVMDNQAPLFSLEPEVQYFSPATSPGVQDELVLATNADPEKEYLIEIINEEEEVIHSWTVSGALQDRILWNGRDNNNNLVPDGNYTVKITGFDKAGNTSQEVVSDIRVDNTPPAVRINVQ